MNFRFTPVFSRTSSTTSLSSMVSMIVLVKGIQTVRVISSSRGNVISFSSSTGFLVCPWSAPSVCPWSGEPHAVIPSIMLTTSNNTNIFFMTLPPWYITFLLRYNIVFVSLQTLVIITPLSSSLHYACAISDTFPVELLTIREGSHFL